LIVKASRLFNDDDGTSHFDDVGISIPLAEDASHSDTERFQAPEVFLRAFANNMTWPAHGVPNRQLVVVLQGSLEMEASDGEVRTFNPGDLLIAEDVEGPGHVSRPGSDVVTLHVYVPDSFSLEPSG
jgi:hypothetical protein